MAVAAALLTADQLLGMPRDEGRYELLEGILHRMPPPGFEHGSIVGRVSGLLFAHVRQHRLGRVLGAETGFRLATDPDTVCAPDVAYVSAGRLQATSFDPAKYFPGAPDLLFEVLSPSDSYSEVEKKVARWIAAGARLVVLVDPAKRLLFAHRPDRPALLLEEGDSLDASDVVAGWTLPVRDAFEDGEP